MIGSFRRAALELWQLWPFTVPAVLIALGLFLAVAVAVAPAARNTKPAPVTYCADAATDTTPRCPPEIRTRVIGTYTSGLVLTVSWTGSGWVAHLPGGRTEPVPMPHDWREP